MRIQQYLRIRVSIDPLRPKITMLILHNVFCTFPKVLIRRFLLLLNNQELLYVLIISIILMTLMPNSGLTLKGEIRCLALFGVKGLN